MIGGCVGGVLAVCLLGCGAGQQGSGASIPPEGPGSRASASPSAGQPRGATAASASQAGGQGRPLVKALWVKAERAACEGGEGPRMCLQVRDTSDGGWRLFYGVIDGFTREESYAYELRVEVVGAEPGAQDAPARRYRLVEIVSKTRATP